MSRRAHVEGRRSRFSMVHGAIGTRGVVGLVLIGLILAIAFIGPLVAPHTIDEPIGLPGSRPSVDAWLGTDFLGRDVVSRMLHGGAGLLILTAISTVITYAIGLSLGMYAGFSKSVADPVIMRITDVVLSFPPILLLLVLLGAAGRGRAVIVIGVVIVVVPGVIRVVRTATQTVATRGFVEASVARGEPTAQILRKDIFPNILPVVIADVGIRFGAAVMLVASLNFLGLGASPPDANWALMVSENRAVVSSNLWSVFGPGLLLGVLAIAINLVGDGYVARLGQSRNSA
ncbi:ABC transporter permease [Aeromicrobium panaciterrae]|uniref:ABC transporter permease n=1 Tax=Aeromicrobium panaciterrae TaxID=363861 RepID=UPI0031E47248